MLLANNWWKKLQRLTLSLLVLLAVVGLWGCGDRIESSSPTPLGVQQVAGLKSLKEVAPPATIQQLHQILEVKQPQVMILEPQPEQILTDTQVTLKLQVTDLPIFQDPKLQLGSHVEVILDNQDAQAVYDLEKPLTFTNLAAGSHTLRVFAAYPWRESFKNEGAYAQTTFHVFTKTINNKLDPKLPLLTFSSPAGEYGAEPILLDFYLTNAPLHLIAQEDPEDEVPDWRIRVTINGETFVLDQWQPIYLKGWQRGSNWVQLEFIDEQGNVVENVYNNTAKVFTYNPGGKDSLSKLLRGELSVAAAKGIINPTYEVPAPPPEVTPSPNPLLTPSPEPTPTAEVSPEPEVVEEIKPTPSPEIPTPKENKPSPIAEPKITPSPTIVPPPVSPSPAKPAIAPPDRASLKPITDSNSETPLIEN